MAYEQFGLVEALDYNGLVGSTTSAPANTLNAIWRNGTASDAGYGQVALPQVAVGVKVTADNWQDLINTSTLIATHQGTSIAPVPTPSLGTVVSHESAIPSNLTALYSNRLNAASQGATDSNTLTRTSGTWITLTATHTIVFPSNRQADSFFNSGGQLKFTAAHPNGTSAGDVAIRNLCNNIGTVVISAPDSGTANIIGTNFNGVTKIGGGGSAPFISTNRGYHGLTTGDVEFFRQNSAAVPYTNSNISMQSRRNNNRRTITVTITITYDDTSSPIPLANGTNFTVVAQYPETTNIMNTWGSVTLSGTIDGTSPSPVVDAPSITDPTNGETGVPVNQQFVGSAYSEQFGAGTHAQSDWQISTNSGFTNIIEQSLNDTVNLTSWTPGGLPNSTLLYVRVRYRSSTSVTSAYSAPVSFTTIGAPAVIQPSILAPSEGQADVPLAFTYTSSNYAQANGAGTHASSDWQIASDAAFNNVVAQNLGSTTDLESWSIPNSLLDNGTTYYVRVRHRSSGGQVSSYSDGRSYSTVAASVATPSVIDPTDGETIPRAYVFSSSPFSTTTNRIHASSDWQIWDQSQTQLIRAITIQSGNLLQWDYNGEDLLSGTSYEVRVRYRTSGTIPLLSERSDFVSYTTEGGGSVQQPTILAPTNGQTDVPLAFTYQADAYVPVDGAGPHNNTEWEIATDPLFSNRVATPFVNSGDLTQLDYDGTGLQLGQTYYVRVRYRSSQGITSPTSDGVQFSTTAAPSIDAPTITVPSTDTSGIDSTLDYSVESSTYTPRNGAGSHVRSVWQLSDDAGFNNILWSDNTTNAARLTQNTIPASALQPSTTHYLRVRYESSTVSSPNGSFRRLTTSPLPTYTLSTNPTSIVEGNTFALNLTVTDPIGESLTLQGVDIAGRIGGPFTFNDITGNRSISSINVDFDGRTQGTTSSGFTSTNGGSRSGVQPTGGNITVFDAPEASNIEPLVTPVNEGQNVQYFATVTNPSTGSFNDWDVVLDNIGGNYVANPENPRSFNWGTFNTANNRYEATLSYPTSEDTNVFIDGAVDAYLRRDNNPRTPNTIARVEVLNITNPIPESADITLSGNVDVSTVGGADLLSFTVRPEGITVDSSNVSGRSTNLPVTWNEQPNPQSQYEFKFNFASTGNVVLNPGNNVWLRNDVNRQWGVRPSSNTSGSTYGLSGTLQFREYQGNSTILGNASVNVSGTVQGVPMATPDIGFAPNRDEYFEPSPSPGETAGIIFGLFGDGGVRKDGRNFGGNDGRYTVQLENQPIGSTWVPSGANATDYQIQISWRVISLSGVGVRIQGTNINVPSAGEGDSGTSGWRTLATNTNQVSVNGRIEFVENTGTNQETATVEWTVQVRKRDDFSMVATDVQVFDLELDIS